MWQFEWRNTSSLGDKYCVELLEDVGEAFLDVSFMEVTVGSLVTLIAWQPKKKFVRMGVACLHKDMKLRLVQVHFHTIKIVAYALS